MRDAIKSNEIVFKFENPICQSINGQQDIETGVTQSRIISDPVNAKPISMQDSMSVFKSVVGAPMGVSEKDHHVECKPQNNNEYSNSNQTSSQVIKLSNGFRQPKLRRDVVNKTIFRIIRRYYYSLLVKLVPDYKKQKKDNLISMLVSFSEYLFPKIEDSNQVAQVLSALMFRREILLSKMSSDSKACIQVFLDIQSKYTHKLISEALSNKYFRVIFKNFIENGITFFEQDENVVNHLDQYNDELEKIKKLFFSSS